MRKQGKSKRSRKVVLVMEGLEQRNLLTALSVPAPSALRAAVKPSGEAPHRARAGAPALSAPAPDGSVHSFRAARVSAGSFSAANRHKVRGARYDTKIQFSYVGSPGNASVAVNGFVPPSPATVPANPATAGGNAYQSLGGVPYVYAIARTEVTAGQYVTFLNKVDPNGDNPVQPVTGVRLWTNDFSPILNPFSGQINLVENAAPGTHYRLAAGYWRDKPLVNGNLFHFAYFANSLYNGSTVAIDNGWGKSPLGFPVKLQTRYVNLSTQISTGMYDLQDSGYPFFQRQDTSGYVIPSENEWIKAAYYSPYATGNGTHYYYYPTVSDTPPTPLQTTGANPTVDGQGNVIQSNLTPGVAYSNYGEGVVWQPSYDNQSSHGANVVNVGSNRTPSPWLTFDQGGNVVEYTDTAAAPPSGFPNPRDLPAFVKVHGGIANAATYQLWLTATGTSDPYGQAAGQTDTQGGARFGFVPNAKADRAVRSSKRATGSAIATAPTSAGLVYRLDNLNTLDTNYTADMTQAVNLANDHSTYLFLGASFTQSPRALPVYSFLNTATRTHLYTIDPNEAAALSANAQYTSEGVAFSALPPNAGSTNFRRFFNPTTGAYAYSAANADIQFFTSRGYTFDGFAWSVNN